MFKMKKIDPTKSGNEVADNLKKMSERVTAKSVLEQLAASGKRVSETLPEMKEIKKMNSPLNAAKEFTEKVPSNMSNMSTKTSKFVEGLTETGKKIEKQLHDKGIDYKKEGVKIAVSSLGLAAQYLGKQNQKHKILKHAVKFVALMPLRPVLIAAGVGVGVYVIAKKAQKRSIEKQEREKEENLKVARNGVYPENTETGESVKNITKKANENAASNVVEKDFMKSAEK